MSFDYISKVITKLTNGTDPGTNKFLKKKADEKNAELLISAVANYSKVHQELFGKYEGELMQPPEAYLLYHNLSGTFKDFLERENLTVLTPLLELLHTAQGYGYLDEVGTIYGLMWNTPELVISGALRVLEADASPYSFFAFKGGFEKIWSTIVDKEMLDVQYNTQIINIARSHYGSYIHHTVGDGIYLKIDWCDFLVWTPPMTEMLKVLSTAATHDEHHYFGHLHHEIYSVSMMSSTSPFEGEPEAHNYFFENIANKTNHGVIGELTISNVFDGSGSRRKKRSWDNFINLKNRSGKSIGGRKQGNRSPASKKTKKQNQSNFIQNADDDRFSDNSRQNTPKRGRWEKQGKKGVRNGKKSQFDLEIASTSIKRKNKNTGRRNRKKNKRKGKQTRQSFGRQGKQRQSGGKSEINLKVVYQLGKNYSDEAHLNQLAKDYLTEGFDYTDIHLFNTISWPYFYRWSPYEVMKGNHWDVFALQGVYRTWYAGSSVSFESVKSVMEYNNLLLRQCQYHEPESVPEGEIASLVIEQETSEATEEENVFVHFLKDHIIP